ncbi:MAG TPA: HEAT repeat domain-containing protein [Candidatus Xenobia bacterium]|nr:HEAT repeat domain-containing protein [Candidatus Xenobia bacterium]
MNEAPETQVAPRKKPPFLLILITLLFVLVPFLFWRGTWFGRPLSEDETGRYLVDTEHPRKTQHALVQIAQRIEAGDPSVKRWYPQVQTLAKSQHVEIRSTAAWVMGQDNQAAEFHAALLEQLNDPEPLVRQNAALALVRFGDATGRAEIRRMLQPFAVGAPAAGTLAPRLRPDDPVNPGSLLGRIRQGDEQGTEVRSPLPGRVQQWLKREGEQVETGDAVVLLAPDEAQVWEALRALYLIGKADDLEDVELYARGAEGMPERIQEQARFTAEAIRQRTAK